MTGPAATLRDLAALVSAAARCTCPDMDHELTTLLDRLDLSFGVGQEKTEAALRDALGITPRSQVMAAKQGRPLTRREAEVAALAATGLSNPQIAAKLYVSLRTVGNHLASAYAKTGVRGRAGLAQWLRDQDAGQSAEAEG